MEAALECNKSHFIIFHQVYCCKIMYLHYILHIYRLLTSYHIVHGPEKRLIWQVTTWESMGRGGEHLWNQTATRGHQGNWRVAVANNKWVTAARVGWGGVWAWETRHTVTHLSKGGGGHDHDQQCTAVDWLLSGLQPHIDHPPQSFSYSLGRPWLMTSSPCQFRCPLGLPCWSPWLSWPAVCQPQSLMLFQPPCPDCLWLKVSPQLPHESGSQSWLLQILLSWFKDHEEIHYYYSTSSGRFVGMLHMREDSSISLLRAFFLSNVRSFLNVLSFFDVTRFGYMNFEVDCTMIGYDLGRMNSNFTNNVLWWPCYDQVQSVAILMGCTCNMLYETERFKEIPESLCIIIGIIIMKYSFLAFSNIVFT